MLSLRKFANSVRHAGHGIRDVFNREHSFRVHVLALILLVIIIFGLKMSRSDAAILILVAVAVLVLELANSIMERFLDIVSPRIGIQVREMKDIMAGAVLVASLAAAAIGAMLIIPYIKF